VEPHKTFTRHGNDLHTTISLPMTAAALGTQLTLPLLEADVASDDSATATTFELDVRAGTQSGSEQVIRGFGVPSLRGGRGDLIVSIVIDTPTRLDQRQEELLRELAAIRGEESPDGQVHAPQKSMFGRLRDAFNTH
jgi:molecular chaperone DnaJ